MVTWITKAVGTRKTVFGVLLIALGVWWLAQLNQPRPADSDAKPVQSVAVLTPSTASTDGLIRRPIPSSTTSDFTVFGRSYPVLAMRRSAADAHGVFLREWLLQSGESYGPIRVEEQVWTDAVGDRETVLKREAFVAGEIMAKPRDGVARETFAAALTQAGAVSWRPILGSAYWLVRFPSPGLDTKPQALAALARSAEIVAAA